MMIRGKTMSRPAGALGLTPSKREIQSLVNDLRTQAAANDVVAKGELVRIALFKMQLGKSIRA